MRALRLVAFALGLALPAAGGMLCGCSQGGLDSGAKGGGSGEQSSASAGVSGSATAPGGATSAGSGGSSTSGGSGGSNENRGAGASGGGAGGSAATGGSVAGGGGTAAAGTSGGGGAGGSTPGACPVVTDFATWPSGKGPLDVGKLAVTDFKTHTGDAYHYALALAWAGALRFTALTADTTNNAALIAAFNSSSLKSSPPPNPVGMGKVDDRVFGVLPLEIYLQNQDDSAKKLGKDRADNQWLPPLNDKGITTDARYWSDDMFMITGLQVMAYRATKDATYLDNAAKALLIYVGTLRENGLFWHTVPSKPRWGRANGWFVTGMTELLLELPAGGTRDSVMAAYKTHLDALLPLQINSTSTPPVDDGCWRQVVDLASAPPETSSTAMFTMALATGVKNGWLSDPKYAAAARKGWQCVANKTSGNGKLDRTCPGTGDAPANPMLSTQQQFYVELMNHVDPGDLHGQLALFWAANALLRTDCPGVR